MEKQAREAKKRKETTKTGGKGKQKRDLNFGKKRHKNRGIQREDSEDVGIDKERKGGIVRHEGERFCSSLKVENGMPSVRRESSLGAEGSAKGHGALAKKRTGYSEKKNPK